MTSTYQNYSTIYVKFRGGFNFVVFVDEMIHEYYTTMRFTNYQHCNRHTLRAYISEDILIACIELVSLLNFLRPAVPRSKSDGTR